MSSLGVFSDECSTFLDMMNDIGIDKKQQRYIIKKMINIAIRATYYILCCRNRNWGSPDLMQFWIFFWLLFCFVSVFVFVFVFFFLIIQSQAAFLNCLHVARFTIVHSKTQIKFPLLLLYFFYGNDRFFFPNSAGVDILSLRYLWRLTLNGQHLLAGCKRAQANTALLYQSSSLKRNTFFF